MDEEQRLEQFSKLAELLQSSALGEAHWDTVAEAIRVFIGIDHANVLILHPQRLIVDGGFAGHDESAAEEYFLEWSANDPISSQILRAPTGRAMRLEKMMSREAQETTEVFEAFYEPHDIHYQGFIYTPHSNGVFTGISIQNGGSSGPLDSRQLARLDIVGRHLKLAVDTARIVEAAALCNNTMTTLLSRWSLGVVCCDASGYVRETWGAAEDLLRRYARYVAVRGGVLRATEPGIAKRLSRLIASPDYGQHFSQPRVVLGDPMDGQLLECVVIALPEPDSLGKRRGDLRLVILRDADIQPLVDAHFLRRRFGISRAEADVLARLMIGDTVASIAAARGSTVQTIRSYLKALSKKLDCHSQSELVATGWRAVATILG